MEIYTVCVHLMMTVCLMLISELVIGGMYEVCCMKLRRNFELLFWGFIALRISIAPFFLIMWIKA